MKMKLLKLTLAIFFITYLSGCYKLAATDSQGTPQPQPKVTPTIVIMGSSSAAGEGANPIDSSWANRLQATVNQTSTKAKFINLAYGGYTTYEAQATGSVTASRPAPDTARNITKALSLHPTLVLLSYPSNDIAWNFSDTEILNNYAKLTHLLDSAKVQYIIFSTQPRDFPDSTQRMRLKTLNDKIISIYTYRVNNFLDQLSTPTYSIKPQYEAGDGIHLNNAGHAVIFNATLQQPIFMNVVQ
jgi:acyl-CoA thioesterase-1